MGTAQGAAQSKFMGIRVIAARCRQAGTFNFRTQIPTRIVFRLVAMGAGGRRTIDIQAFKVVEGDSMEARGGTGPFSPNSP